jgi:hypothetical protein
MKRDDLELSIDYKRLERFEIMPEKKESQSCSEAE